MLFSQLSTSALELNNRIVMAPMTRNRADINNIPNQLMAEYYMQRSSAGLIITEGTSPSPNGLGYPRMPGLFNDVQAKEWAKVTSKVHKNGGKIFVQLMHTGRVSHIDSLPDEAEVLGPMNIQCPGEIFTDSQGLVPHSQPRSMTETDIQRAIDEHVHAAKLAIEAGFDGVELHAANGYLIEQFLNANINQREDSYGGSATARNLFALQIVQAVVNAIGAERVGIRLSPYGVLNGTGPYPEVAEQYSELLIELNKLNLIYVHLLDHSSMGTPPVPEEFIKGARKLFNGLLILTGGFDKAKAEAVLTSQLADLIGFGRAFISNPDLPERLVQGVQLTPPDMSSFYTPGEKGYIDYPSM